jgi:hypothetical protein
LFFSYDIGLRTVHRAREGDGRRLVVALAVVVVDLGIESPGGADAADTVKVVFVTLPSNTAMFGLVCVICPAVPLAPRCPGSLRLLMLVPW